MRKKLGEVQFKFKLEDKETEPTSPIWGYIFETNDGIVLHGIYFNVSPLVYELMFQDGYIFDMNDAFQYLREKHKIDEFGERWSIGVHGLDETGYNEVLKGLSNFKYRDKKMGMTVKINKDWKLIKNEHIMRQL